MSKTKIFLLTSKLKLLFNTFLLPVFLCIHLQFTPQAQTMERCHTTESYERLKIQYPEYEQNRQQIERQIQEIITQRDVVNGITIIPCVYHVIHDGDAVGAGENLSTALLQAQLDQMNDDFRRTNADAGNTPAAFAGVAADTEIEFCLAQLDPNENTTTGINRINVNTLSGVNTNDCWDDDYIDANIKSPTVWDRNRYLNIWVVFKINRSDNCANTILGYAQFPGGPANSDGIVLRATTVGSLASPNPAGGDYSFGRTGTHEVGHWLNLFHVWGNCSSSCCGVDDSVSDTPNASEPNYTSAPCTYPGPDSCDEGASDLPDMFQNYMDYSDDQCMNLFTQGQATRMNAAIAASRPGLLTAQCGPSCVDNLVLSGTLDGAYEASNTIITSGVTTVPSTNDVTMRAPDFVRLNNGFSTVSFAGLDIRYGTCSSVAPTPPNNRTTEIERFRTAQPVLTNTKKSEFTEEEVQAFRQDQAVLPPSKTEDLEPEELRKLIARDRKDD